MTGEAEPERMAAFFVRNTGVKTVVIKLGAEGCFVYDRGKGYTVPAFRVDTVDTTGAGDNFIAGFMHAYLEGMELRECAWFACATAAVSTRYLGATSPETKLENIGKLLSG